MSKEAAMDLVKVTSEKPIRVFVAIPCYGNMVGMNTVVSLVQLLNVSHLPLVYEFMGNESLVTRARNRLTHKFLKSDCTHLLWIDADIGFNPLDVFRLLAADKDVTAGAYTMKRINWGNVKKANAMWPNVDPADLELVGGSFALSFDTRDAGKKIPLNQPCRVNQVGTGFMMIKREVFEKLKACPAVEASLEPHEGEIVHKYWRTGPNEDGVELSEDYFFCYMCRKIGIDTYVIPDIVLNHTGVQVFKGSIPFLSNLDGKDRDNGRAGRNPD